MNVLLPLRLLVTAIVALAFNSLADYSTHVREDQPVAYWRFSKSGDSKISNLGSLGKQADGEIEGKVNFAQPGPRPSAYPDFDAENVAARFGTRDSFIRIKSSSSNPLAFKRGDTISIEAWVYPEHVGEGGDIYIVGKGRTQNPGFTSNNQNWALRLHGKKGKAHLSFLFRDERNLPNGRESWHRWISAGDVGLCDRWHHVLVTYTFGKGDSVRGWIDGVETKGEWDYGGKTDLGPVVDNDEVWVGSSMGGSAGSTFEGLIDEVAIYRSALSSDRIAKRFNYKAPAAKPAEVVVVRDAPSDIVRVEILETPDGSESPVETASVGADSANDTPDSELPAPVVGSWKNAPSSRTDEFTQSAFALATLPTKYSSKAIKIDRSSPFLVRASAKLNLPAGEHRLLLRAHNTARLVVDGVVLNNAPAQNVKHADSEDVPDQAAKTIQGTRVLPPGHTDLLVTFKSDGKPHIFVMEAFVGGKKIRPEIGETCVAVAGKDGAFRLLAPKAQVALTDESWEFFAATQKAELSERDVAQRRVISAAEDKYWAKRHENARQLVSKTPAPTVPAAAGFPANNAVDSFINQKLAAAKIKPAALTDDSAFLRRVCLDITGLIPATEQIAAFQTDKSANRRARVIDSLLASPSWADHWVSYWQDVLAENPGMLKPTLNNTGPFRWFIYDSFRDNKPMDRFVTELVAMDGSLYYGGPAGFAMASENDVPMAAKAHIVSKAFLGMELGCARCHDAPYHPFKQEQLFSMAAMLKKGPQKVPLTSSIPTNSNIKVGRIVQVTLQPGSTVKPAWPFTQVVNRSGANLNEEVRHHGDTREELATLMTDPRNERFPKVIVNRLWKQYMGWGIVEPVDDWPENPKASHPELLDWLARELVTSGYDLKHVARIILNSQAYQRVSQHSAAPVPEMEARLFEAPVRRRMTAEQLVDSLFTAAGKSFRSEELNQDVDGRRPAQDFNNLGIPKRSWEFCSLANERDRPALALPRAQAIVDTLMMFGWRESRQSPLTVRDESPNVLQPANLANSTVATRIVRLSDDSAITKLALADKPLPDLIKATFMRVLTRTPTDDEMKLFASSLEQGYAERWVAVDPKHQKKSGPRQAVSWSNHLNAEATKIKLEAEREARAGEPPTAALKADWRERMEDMVWAMVNSPEFVFVP